MVGSRLEAVIDELIYLRKGAGVTQAKLLDTTHVGRLCGHPQTEADQVFLRFQTAVHSLRDHPHGEALEAAYGLLISVTGSGIRERRELYGRMVGRKVDALRDWEDEVIRELALRLLAAFYAGSATPDGLVLPHGGFLLTDLHTLTIIRDSTFQQSEQTRTLVSLVDGAAGFMYGTYSPTDIEPIAGIAEVRTTSHPGGTLHQLMFPGRLRRSESWQFKFRETVPSGQPTRDPIEELRPTNIDFSGQTFETPTLKYRCEVCFFGDTPEVIWAYDKLSRIARPGGATRENTIVMAAAMCSAEFYEIYGGLCSGIAWAWKLYK